MEEALRELALQIFAVPGAPDKLLADYFPGVQALAVEGLALESWKLASDRRLDLNRAQNGTLCLVLRESATPLLNLPLPQGLDTIAAQAAAATLPLSPIVLALVALAMGLAEGDKALAAHEAKLVKSAKELMLIAACRLCG